MAPKARDSGCSAKMGQLLLAGYCMLAENCPDCMVPLMRDPKTMAQHCCNCSRVFPPGGRPEAAQASGASASGAPSAASAAGGGGDDDEEDDDDAGGAPDPRDAFFQAINSSLSAAAATTTHAATISPSQATTASSAEGRGAGAPTVSSYGLGSRTAELVARMKVQEAPDVAAASATGAGAATLPKRAAAAATPDPSELMAQKMLQGWALLDTYCPRCTTALLRNRQKQMYCVACEAWVVAEAEAPAAMAVQQQQQQQQQQQRQNGGAASGRGEGSPSSSAVPSSFRLADGRLPAAPRDTAPAVVAATATAAAAAAAPAEASPSPSALAPALTATLARKLAEAERLLAAMSVEHHVDSCRSVVGLISDCLLALQRAQQLLPE